MDDARLSTDEKLLESAFIANYHREGMTDLEEAHALKQLVDYYGGSQTKACKRLSMSASTLSSKLSLLKLSPELQKDLMAGERKTEHVRNLSKLPPEAQKAKANERAEASQRRSRTRHAPVAKTTDIHGVKSNGAVTVNAQGALPVATNRQAAHEEAIPEQRDTDAGASQEGQTALKMFPYHDGAEAAILLLHKMPPEELDKVLEMLLRDREERRANSN